MCGIITVIKKKDDNISTQISIQGMLNSQIHRGSQGFGYVGFGETIDSYVRRETREEIEKCLEKNSSQSIMFHHRFPTSTPNYADCAHPIKVSNPELKYNYYLIHNGVISNDHILKEKHDELGYKYTTTIEKITKTENHSHSTCKWNDSEALAIDVARLLDGKQETLEVRGSIAFVCLRVEKETGKVLKVFFGRNSSPLTIKIDKNSLILRSEGETEFVEQNMLYEFNLSTFKLTKSPLQIGEIMSTRYNYSNHDDEDDRDGWRDYFSSTGAYRGGPYALPPARSRTFKVADGIDTTRDHEVVDPSIEDIEALEEASRLDDKIGEIEIEIIEINTEIQAYRNLGEEEYIVEIEQLEGQVTKLEEQRDELEEEYHELMYGDLEEVIDAVSVELNEEDEAAKTK